ncbi:MAG TPA: KUP/HAK/KT family potassium transporter, partial [Clostridia bacterium]|nr:KUP/HAK/KT family potassium transporter [Clostridia bacterium]
MKTVESGRAKSALVIGALGVVYGDIGTSPLYALRECFHGSHALPVTSGNVLGVLSLIFWSLVIIVSIKYLGFVVRANNKGEGGILALLALVQHDRNRSARRAGILMALGLFGAGLLYGDGAITPALTVLSAVEGLKVATPVFEHFVVPIALAVLIGLFSIQKHGTGRVGSAFGPIMLVWFVTLALLGIKGLVLAPEVAQSINPLLGLEFLATSGWTGFVVLGAVFLVVTGAEALYADMGHFGIRPIRQAWFGLVLPSLFLNYLGQGALLLHNPTAAENPFYNLAPAWARYPLVGISTLAAIV